MDPQQPQEIIASARRYAEQFAKERNLAPRVEIEDLVEEFVQLEYADLPGSAEAVLLRLSDGDARILLREQEINANRRRFTLAHELGHLVIPWQYGSTICHGEDIRMSVSDATAIIEQEANVFASGILIPQSWIRAAVPESAADLAVFVVEASELAGVSPITAAIAIAQASVRRVALWAVTNSGKIYAAQSTTCPLLKNVAFSPDYFKRLSTTGAIVSSSMLGGTTVFAAEFGRSTVAVTEHDQSSSAILQEIIAEFGLDAAERRSLFGQVHGVVGKANNDFAAAQDETELLALLAARFFGRANLARISAHKHFHSFLSQKARELMAKRR